MGDMMACPCELFECVLFAFDGILLAWPDPSCLDFVKPATTYLLLLVLLPLGFLAWTTRLAGLVVTMTVFVPPSPALFDGWNEVIGGAMRSL